MPNEVLASALAYHGLGWSLLPIKPGTKEPDCRSWSQFQQKRASIQQVQKWFDGRPDRGLAVVLGAVSGDLFCRDFDRLDGYERWAAENVSLAHSFPTVGTARGRHVYVRAKFGRIEKKGDGELRGNGYCVLPPSIHPDGVPYHWIVPLANGIPHVELDSAGFLAARATERTETTESTKSAEDNRRRLTPLVETPFAAFKKCVDLEDSIQHAISTTIPKSFGSRNRQVFEFARALKAIQALKDVDPNTLQPYVRQWHAIALPKIETHPFEETWIDFLRGWPRVNFPLGEEPMTEIFARAVENADSGFSYQMRGIRVLASLCRELQRCSENEPFFLSCRKAGELLGVDHTTANRWFFLLENDKVIETTAKGTRENRKANRYRFLKQL